MDDAVAIMNGLTKFARKTNWEDLPEQIIKETKYLILDSLGDALAAITTDKGKMTIALAKRFGGTPEASIIGIRDKVSVSSAAFANGELIQIVDYDAIMSNGHAPPSIIPVILGIAETVPTSGKDFILATALGFEVSHRVAGAVQRPAGGFQGTQGKAFTWGTRNGQAYSNFGAAAGAGRLLGLNADQMANALGIAGHLTKVLTHARHSFSAHRALTKYEVPGWQNTGAVSAVLLAEMGYIGDTTIFDAEHGFWKFCGFDGWYPENILRSLGKNWDFITRVQYKKYPCCGMLHGAIECLYEIINENNLMPDEIKNISAYCHPTVEMPCFTNPEIANIVDAQFNPRYVFSVVANRIKVGVEWLDMETIKSPQIQGFMKRVKISCQAHPEYGKQLLANPLSALSKVEVIARGQKFSAERRHEPGRVGTESRMTEEELVSKFRHNASRVLTQNKIDEAVKVLLALEKVGDLASLMQIITI